MERIGAEIARRSGDGVRVSGSRGAVTSGHGRTQRVERRKLGIGEPEDEHPLECVVLEA